jgi:tetratricopeptide (TPR) repeat protein
MQTSIASAFSPIFRSFVLSKTALSGLCVVLLALPFAPCEAQSPSAPKALSADDPRIAQTALERANQLLRTGAKSEAISLIDSTLKQFPRDPQLRFLRAVLHAESGERVQAIAILEQITQDFPELPEPYNNLAVLHSQMGNVDMARRALEEAVRALPGYALAQQNLGDIYLQLAARAYDLAARSGPATAAAPSKRLELVRELIKKLD